MKQLSNIIVILTVGLIISRFEFRTLNTIIRRSVKAKFKNWQRQCEATEIKKMGER